MMKSQEHNQEEAMTTITEKKFQIVPAADVTPGQTGFYVYDGTTYLTDKKGGIRVFSTRNTARKRISREYRGDFHR